MTKPWKKQVSGGKIGLGREVQSAVFFLIRLTRPFVSHLHVYDASQTKAQAHVGPNTSGSGRVPI